MISIEEHILQQSNAKGEVVIDLKDVGKKYVIHHDKPTLAEDLGRLLQFKEREEYWVFRNITLQIRKGERVGFHGVNGAGKTTLLKIIAGLTSPTEGQVRVLGKVTSLIDLAAGFHPDLSGYENIFLSGLIIGMNKAEITNKLSSIIEFSGLGDFITVPVAHYSSGMILRLGFSIAIHSDPDILLLDEVMHVGDVEFQKKSSEAIKTLFEKGTTILMISQFVDYLKIHCQRILTFSKNS